MKKLTSLLSVFALGALLIPNVQVSMAEAPVTPDQIGQATHVAGPFAIEEDPNHVGINHDFTATELLGFTARTLDSADPSTVGVHVRGLLRRNHEYSLPDPSNGAWYMPFGLKIVDSEIDWKEGTQTGQIMVLDSMGPLAGGFQPPRVMFYDFEYDYIHGGFTATEVELIVLPLDYPPTADLEGMLYPTSVVLHSSGRMIVADCFLSGIWVSDVNRQTFELVYTSQDIFPIIPVDTVDTIDFLGMTLPGFWVPTYDRNTDSVLQVPMSFHKSHSLPGIHGLTYVESHDAMAFVYSGANDQVQPPIVMMDIDDLFDTTIAHDQKDDLLTVLVPGTKGLSDWVGEVRYDPSNPNWVYYVRAPMMDEGTPYEDTYNRMYRVNVNTLEIELVVDNITHFNFPTNMSSFPCGWGWSCYTVTNTEEQQLFETNEFLAMFGGPDNTAIVPAPLMNVTSLPGSIVSVVIVKNNRSDMPSERPSNPNLSRRENLFNNMMSDKVGRLLRLRLTHGAWTLN